MIKCYMNQKNKSLYYVQRKHFCQNLASSARSLGDECKIAELKGLLPRAHMHEAKLKLCLSSLSVNHHKNTQTGHLDRLHATVAMLIFREKACLHEIGEAVLIHEFPATSYCRKSL